MINPISTYRFQFHKEFSFNDFEKIISYIQKLGVGTVYASPIFEATPGSVHGYDSVDPHNINPEIGTQEQLKDISKRLKEQGINWLQDIVPNHMAFDPNNPWLKDVLEKGQRSVYASFFDVPWTGEIYSGKVMIPILGSPLDEVIRNGELRLDFAEPRFVLKYYESAWPVRLRSYVSILQAEEGEPAQAIQQLLEQIKEIQKTEGAEAYTETLHELQLQITALLKNEKTKGYIENCIEQINSDKELLTKIANEQVYQLCEWQKTDYQINFRRFFTVNGLICLNMQHAEVFQYYHSFIKQLIDEGVIQGLRVDHIDGLYDPTGYLEQLRELAGDETYIVVEKILEPNEEFPAYWRVQGNTGYDFLAMVNNVFTQKRSEEQFIEFYQKLVNDDRTIHEQLHDKKSYILHENMAGELENLYNLFLEMSLAEKSEVDQVPPELLKEAIAEFLIKFPVYRFYGNHLPLSAPESQNILNLLISVRNSKPELTPATDLLEKALLIKPKDFDSAYNARALRFYQRCMQFTGPLMAKGVEDTLMYTYNTFIGHNEVGDSPEAFGASPEQFHQQMIDRQQKWPLSINGTSTHDTKRGEDVRARLNVLTDLSDEWFNAVTEWREMNKSLKTNNALDANDEYLIYQTLLGAYPMPGEDEDDFEVRIQEYLQKAMREAKTHSNWTTPNEEYENAAKNFAVRLLDRNTPCWPGFEKLHKKVSDYGIINSLSQLLLKFTCPGVPDVYQGTELWDLSLVDPDNRRAVDYQKRQRFLEEIESTDFQADENFINQLWEQRYNGKIKLWLLHQLLNDRKQNVELLSEGDYIPLNVEGEFKDNVLAFARRYEETWRIVAVPLHLAFVSKQQQKEILSIDWSDTRIVLPGEAPLEYEHFLFKTQGKHQTEIAIKDIFKKFPLAILKLK